MRWAKMIDIVSIRARRLFSHVISVFFGWRHHESLENGPFSLPAVWQVPQCTFETRTVDTTPPSAGDPKSPCIHLWTQTFSNISTLNNIPTLLGHITVTLVTPQWINNKFEERLYISTSMVNATLNIPTFYTGSWVSHNTFYYLLQPTFTISRYLCECRMSLL